MDENTKVSTATENDGAVEPNKSVDQVESVKEKGATEKTFGQQEVDRMIASRIKREREKWEQTIHEKVTEAQRMASMTAEQRAQAEREQVEKQLAEKESELNRRELRLTAIDSLADKGLPIELADCLSYTDAESCQKSLDAVSKAFGDAVSKGINDRLRQAPPKTGGTSTSVTKEQFAQMGYAERVALKRNDPEQFQKLSNYKGE